MFANYLKYRLRKRMRKEYKKTYNSDYSDCGFPIEHLERDLHLTFLKLLDDDNMRRWSFLSRKAYQEVVIDYYENIRKDFVEENYR